jgi:hypothetical protein
MSAVRSASGGKLENNCSLRDLPVLTRSGHLGNHKTFRPLQAPETYNLDGILKAIQAVNKHPSD